MERRHVPTAARWASRVGYSRAIRVGDRIWVSGTVSVGEDGAVAHPGDAYLQARRCLEIITGALRELGAGPEHIVRTRMFVTDVAHWEAVGRAHAELLADVLPATTMVFAGLIDPALLVEIEAEAIVG